MFDMHYDLLTIAYVAYLSKDYTYLNSIINFYNEQNVKGLVANLYFMSQKEMKEELHPKYYQENVSVVEMFKISKEMIENLLPNTKIIYSIEGCDFLNIDDLDELYELGLRNILITWNNKNKYASGNRSNYGLTEEGRKLIDKALDLNISLDLSHLNEKSFYDVINYIKLKQNQGYNPTIIASHSNSRALCNRDRNLKDEQLQAIKEVNGIVGVFSNRNFIVEEDIKEKLTSEEKKLYYLKHINHMVNILGIDNVALATDDMDFLKEIDAEYGEISIYDYQNIKEEVEDTLSKCYNQDEIHKLMYLNAKKIYNSLMNNKYKVI